MYKLLADFAIYFFKIKSAYLTFETFIVFKTLLSCDRIAFKTIYK